MEMDELFYKTKNTLADKVEEGIKLFDPTLVTGLLTDWVCNDAETLQVPRQSEWFHQHALLPNGLVCMNGRIKVRESTWSAC